jgi:DNA invertase Pin-like site-specific DNA recombinase
MTVYCKLPTMSTKTRTRTRSRTTGVIAYTRVSTEEQAVSGLSLEAQRAAIEAECQRRGLDLLAVHEDAGYSAKTLSRPGLTAALDDLHAGRGSALMVARLDRLTRSVHDATGLMQAAERAGWGLVALDVAVDTTTPQGAAMAQVLAVFAELERRLIGERTRAALAAKRAQGVRLGRPVTLDPATRDRIVAAHRGGQGWSAIARQLNDDRVPTAHGGARWYPSTVRSVALADTEAT